MKRSKAKTEAQMLMATYLEELGLSFREEVRFHNTRKWRFDYAGGYGLNRWAIEIEGGSWIGGRHNSGAGFNADLEKYATATSMGWTVFRFSPQMIRNGLARTFLANWMYIASRTHA